MKINLSTKAVPVFAISMFLALGISACNKSGNETNPAKISDSKMEESIDKTIDESQEVMSDSWITTKVKSELMADSLSKGFDVKVATEDGVVSLEGMLQNQEAVDHVSRLAAAVQGVARVDGSKLVVQP